jgi:hypothetical protein
MESKIRQSKHYYLLNNNARIRKDSNQGRALSLLLKEEKIPEIFMEAATNWRNVRKEMSYLNRRLFLHSNYEIKKETLEDQVIYTLKQKSSSLAGL